MVLADYTVAGVAEVEYTSTVADFRFVNDSSLGLVDSSAGNVKTYELVDNICLLYTSPSPRDRG